MADVAVIGAGIGGLAAALRLIGRGHTVTVYEAGDAPGGKLGRAQHDGVWFDTGPSVLTMPDVFADLFSSVGESMEDHVELVRHDHVFDYVWPDGARVQVMHDPEQTVASVGESLGAAAADELRRFLAYAEKIWSAAAPPFVYGDAPTFGTAVSLGVRSFGAIRKIDPMRTMIEGIRRHISDPRLIDILARYATYNGSDPWQAPATLNCIAHVELALGCFGVAGGMYALVEAITALLRDRGATIQLGAYVERVRARDGRFDVEVHGEQRIHDAIVANADAAHVYGDLVPALAGEEAGPPSMSGWTAVLSAPSVADRAPHTAFFPADYRAEFVDIFENQRAPRQPTVYVCSQGHAHRRETWADRDILFVMANAPALHAGSDEDARHLRTAVEARLRQVGVWTQDTQPVWERGPQGLADRFPGSRGAIYGASSNSRFSAFQRPPNRVGSMPGLYLASGSAHPGGGVPLCALSGAAAARAIDSDFG